MFQKIAVRIAFSDSFPYLVTVLGFTSLAVIQGWRWWKQKNTYKFLHSLPSPPGHWLLGNAPQVLAAVKQKKYFQLLFDWSQQLGPMYVLLDWQSSFSFLSKPKVIEDTIVNGMRDGSLVRAERALKAWNDISGPILLGQNGAEWQWRRKAWNPEFSSGGLSKYVEIISQACEQVIEILKETDPAKEVEIDPVFVETDDEGDFPV